MIVFVKYLVLMASNAFKLQMLLCGCACTCHVVVVVVVVVVLVETTWCRYFVHFRAHLSDFGGSQSLS